MVHILLIYRLPYRIYEGVVMKKSSLVLVPCLFAILVFATQAFSTPIFNGNPYASFDTGDDGIPLDPQGPGYYIWANDLSRNSWSIRWTGKDWKTGSSEKYDWSGSITFSNNDGIENASKVRWESGDGSVSITDLGGSDMIVYGTAHAGPDWDGIDFTLKGVEGDYLTFNLYSSFFTSDNDGVYIGADMVSVLDHCDSTDDFRSGTGTNRQFEIAAPVPEPATLLLFGMGLIFLGGFTKKKSTRHS